MTSTAYTIPGLMEKTSIEYMEEYICHVINTTGLQKTNKQRMITKHDLTKDTRELEVKIARQFMYHFLKTHKRYIHSKIGRRYKRNASSVTISLQRFYSSLSVDKTYKEIYDKIFQTYNN